MSLVEHNERARVRDEMEATAKALAREAGEKVRKAEADAIEQEQRYGPTLDRMNPAELEALLANGNAFERDYVRLCGVKPGGTGRLLAIRLLAAREQLDKPP